MINITTADWLVPGWIVAPRIGGGIHTGQIMLSNPQPIDRASAILDAIEQMQRQFQFAAVFLSKEDCALVCEYFPDAFKRQEPGSMNM